MQYLLSRNRASKHGLSTPVHGARSSPLADTVASSKFDGV
jgi:hypothetical protein